MADPVEAGKVGAVGCNCARPSVREISTASPVEGFAASAPSLDRRRRDQSMPVQRRLWRWVAAGDGGVGGTIARAPHRTTGKLLCPTFKRRRQAMSDTAATVKESFAAMPANLNADAA